MTRATFIFLGTVWAVTLLIASLWGWLHADEIVSDWRRPELGYWSVCSAAIGLAAAGQLVVMTFVVANVYRRDVLGDVFRATAAIACTVALVAAVTLGIIGR
jgi:hypothetical protein